MHKSMEQYNNVDFSLSLYLIILNIHFTLLIATVYLSDNLIDLAGVTLVSVVTVMVQIIVGFLPYESLYTYKYRK